MKKLLLLSLFAWSLPLSLGAQNYSINWFTIDGGGGASSGGAFTVSGTVGQPDAGQMSGGNFTVAGGFWGLDLLERPRLSIAHNNGLVRIAWPRPSTGWLLDSAASLIAPMPPNAWSPVLVQYQTNATEISVSVPSAPGYRFFRLRRP
jgi:hypothetical protein